MKLSSLFSIALVLGLASIGPTLAGSWTPLLHQPTFNAGTAHLLTDGTVMVQDDGARGWWKLAPDSFGDYVNGTWTQLASLPSNYAPLYFASAVLPDGRLIVEGGEYNFGNPVWTTLGAIYDPLTNVWTAVNPPAGWTTIGDAQSVVLPDGRFLLANCCSTQAAFLDATTLTWIAARTTGKADSNNEEGWTLLPDGSILSVDCNNTANLTHAEKFLATKGKWVSAGSTIVKLPDLNANGSGSHEMGPALLRPDGTVWAVGATGHTSVYTPPPKPSQPGSWVAGPDFPIIAQGQLDVADGPAALLPDGKVLVGASPGIFQPPTRFFEFDGTTLTEVPATPNSPGNPSYVGRMLVLPTGEIFYTDGSRDVEVYLPTGTFQSAWKPTIATFPSVVVAGQTYTLTGTHLNGFSEGANYGDDAASATNFPLVRITNRSTGHVQYVRTHGFSSMAVANPRRVSVLFDVPAGIETGTSDLEVVTNGINSSPVTVTVNP
jgi:hypothetical protein